MQNKIFALQELSKNLWWSWDTEAKQIFEELSPLLWERNNHNPIDLLHQISDNELLARSNSKFGEKIDRAYARFQAYLTEKNTWAANNTPELVKNPVAYFSAEFGIHESMRIYSGGLGVLAGDHLKSASDLGINFIGITLFYREGYFRQHLNHDGWQIEDYPLQHPENLPLEKVTNPDGGDLIISVNIAQSDVFAQVWKLKVGRATLYLLDSNTMANESHYRDICCRVYGGDQNMRINQEILLGIGGVKLLSQLGIKPTVYHMNEGHSAFLTLELLAKELASGVSEKEAIENVRSQCVFTTHTPVPAGHDRFSRDMMHYTFDKYLANSGMSFDNMMLLGSEDKKNIHGLFTMTVLALNLSRSANGVSKLHGEVSRTMWQHLFPTNTVNEVPIGHITNGVHTSTWACGYTESFWRNFTENIDDMTLTQEATEAVLAQITDEDLWSLRYNLKRHLFDFIDKYLANQLFHQHQHLSLYQNDYFSIQSVNNTLSADVLTIGFARRFATYKRAPLIFRDLERLNRIINHPSRPLQIVFAGKAHPHDDAGKDYIRQIVDHARRPQFAGKVIFLENYNLGVAKRMVSGVDVWLNTPVRPMEASGTSGEKNVLHGGLNFSVLDGWWPEAYNGENGFSIGNGESFENHEEQDSFDAEQMYAALETQIIPAFYDRNENNIPVQWIKKIRNAIATIAPEYNTHRMVRDYATRYYVKH
ncbi:MAG: alpha-glucan family phosphorylase [Chlorobium sp.]|nr:MAG: alpha-glucan family phosphorylase [Chlorobium sp.]